MQNQLNLIISKMTPRLRYYIQRCVVTKSNILCDSAAGVSVCTLIDLATITIASRIHAGAAKFQFQFQSVIDIGWVYVVEIDNTVEESIYVAFRIQYPVAFCLCVICVV